MQLLLAHQILIGSAIALAAIFGLRALVVFSRGGDPSNVLVAGAAFVVMGALVMYFRVLRARWRAAQRDA